MLLTSRTLDTRIGTSPVNVPHGMYLATSSTPDKEGIYLDLHHRNGVPVKPMGLGTVYPHCWATTQTVDEAAGYRVHSYHYQLPADVLAATFATVGEAAQALLSFHGYQA